MLGARLGGSCYEGRIPALGEDVIGAGSTMMLTCGSTRRRASSRVHLLHAARRAASSSTVPGPAVLARCGPLGRAGGGGGLRRARATSLPGPRAARGLPRPRRSCLGARVCCRCKSVARKCVLALGESVLDLVRARRVAGLPHRAPRPGAQRSACPPLSVVDGLAAVVIRCGARPTRSGRCIAAPRSTR